jgi:hypothetical protein
MSGISLVTEGRVSVTKIKHTPADFDEGFQLIQGMYTWKAFYAHCNLKLYIKVRATYNSWVWHKLRSCSAIFWCIFRFYHECKQTRVEQHTPFDLLLKVGVYTKNVLKTSPHTYSVLAFMYWL